MTKIHYNIKNKKFKLKKKKEVNNDQKRMVEADPLTTMWEVVKEPSTECSMVVRHLKHIAKLKKLDKLVPHELTEN